MVNTTSGSTKSYRSQILAVVLYWIVRTLNRLCNENFDLDKVYLSYKIQIPMGIKLLLAWNIVKMAIKYTIASK